MKKFTLLLGALLVTFSSATFAGQWTPTGGVVTRMETAPATSDRIYVQLSGATVDEGCNSTLYYSLNRTHGSHKEIVMMLTVSLSTGNPIRLFIDGCTGSFGTVDRARLEGNLP